MIDVLVEQAETKLAEAVEARRLTEAEKSEMLAGIRERVTDLVNGRSPRLRPPGSHRHRPGAYFRPDSF